MAVTTKSDLKVNSR